MRLLKCIVICLVTWSFVFGQDTAIPAQFEIEDSAQETLSLKISFDHARALELSETYAGSFFAFPLHLDAPIPLQHGLKLSLAAGGEYALQISASQGRRIAIMDDRQDKVLELDLTSGKTILTEFLLPGNYTIDSEGTATVLHGVFVEPQRNDRGIGFGMSWDCEINTACTLGKDYTDQIRSVVRIMMVTEQGIAWCSGSLMNNTNQDGTPYVLTAHHCLLDNTPLLNQWRFDFHYASTACANPLEEPTFISLTGCKIRARSRDSDFMLLELDSSIPLHYDVFYSGWDRRDDYTPDSVILIHHPAGDIKKISRDLSAVEIVNNELTWTEGYLTPARHHLRARFDNGAYEGGSSGAPLYNSDGLVVAQLHGGNGDCAFHNAFCGRLHASWQGEEISVRLSDWLDPLNTGQLILPGMEHPDLGNSYDLFGQLADRAGRAMEGVEITLQGGYQLKTLTDAQGRFSFPLLPRSAPFEVSASKNTDQRNGVTAIDLLFIQKHLIGLTPLTDAQQLIAADATGNGNVSVTDILILQKLLLNQIQFLPTQNAWVFDPPVITLMDVQEEEVMIELTGIKIGDINGTADPNR